MTDNVAYSPSGSTLFATHDDSTAHHQKVIIEGQNAAGDPVGIGHAEDEPHASGDGGVLALVVRKDTAAALAGTDGDYIPLTVDSTGRLWVNGSGVTQPVSIAATVTTEPTATKADDAAFAPATDKVLMLGAEADDTSPDSVDEGDAGALRMSTRRELYTQLRDAAGNERGANVTAANALKVDGSAVTQPISGSVTVSGTVTANAGTGTLTVEPTATQVDDAAFTPASGKIVMLGAEADDTSPDSVDEGDGGALRMSLRRELYTQIRDAAGNERGVNVTSANALKVDGSAVTQPVSGTITASNAAGDVAHDGADSGNPVKVGVVAIAHGANPSEVSASLDRTNIYANRAGILFTIGGHPNIITRRDNYTGAQTDTAIVSVSAGTKIVVTRIGVRADNANTAAPSVIIGLGATNTPTGAGVLDSHPGLPGGGGMNAGDGSAIVGVGADGEDLRITCGAPTGGSLSVLVSYFTIPS